MEKTKTGKGKRYSKLIHEKARELRRQGKMIRDIAEELRVAKSSVVLWVRDVALSADQKKNIRTRRDERVWTPELRKRQSEIAKAHMFGGREIYTKEELLKKIADFYEQNHRIPLKREFNMYRVYQLRFGSWNAAIRAAGFYANPQIFAYKFKAADGHLCDSFTEKIIDDWLFRRGITHQRNWHYGNTKMTADFFVGLDVVIEFFGLAGVQSKYDLISEKKRMYCGEHYLQLLEIYPDDLFPENHLSEIGEKLDILLEIEK